VPAPIRFTPVSTFDTNGFFYWMGTNRSSTVWGNPGAPTCIPATSCVSVTRSSSGSLLQPPYVPRLGTRPLTFLGHGARLSTPLGAPPQFLGSLPSLQIPSTPCAASAPSPPPDLEMSVTLFPIAGTV
jgi:hypothetical protein